MALHFNPGDHYWGGADRRVVGTILCRTVQRHRSLDDVLRISRPPSSLPLVQSIVTVVDPKEGVRDAIVVLATPVDTDHRHLKEWRPA